MEHDQIQPPSEVARDVTTDGIRICNAMPMALHLLTGENGPLLILREDGTVVFGKMNADEASMAFWKAIETIGNPCRPRMQELEMKLARLSTATRAVLDGLRQDSNLVLAETLKTEVDKVLRLLDGGSPSDAATEAFDAIAKLCGCPEWQYPGQLVRDVAAVVAAHDEALERARSAEEACEREQEENDALLAQVKKLRSPAMGDPEPEATTTPEQAPVCVCCHERPALGRARRANGEIATICGWCAAPGQDLLALGSDEVIYPGDKLGLLSSLNPDPLAMLGLFSGTTHEGLEALRRAVRMMAQGFTPQDTILRLRAQEDHEAIEALESALKTKVSHGG